MIYISPLIMLLEPIIQSPARLPISLLGYMSFLLRSIMIMVIGM